MSANALDQDLFTAAVDAMPVDELSTLRGKAADQFVSQGFPTTRDENWKYTTLSAAADISNVWLSERVAETPSAPQIPSPGASQLETINRIDAHWLVIRNGIVDSSALHQIRKSLGDDLKISNLSDEPGLADINIDDPMSAFNAALLLDGLHIRVAANANVNKPLGILQIDDPSRKTSQIRIVIEMSENARLQVVECALSAETGAQFSNSVTEARLAVAARLGFVRIQCRSEDHVGVNRLVATLDRDASLCHDAFDFGGSLVRNDIVVNISGKNAAARLQGLYLASGRQHIDNHTRVEHRVGPATSHEEYRGILTGHSRCVFNGQAVVFEGADGTDANQSNHNLLLSDHAEIDTKPELEIYADDVKCSHGATVGQLDESSLFYLRSRGLDQETARHLLTQAFAAGILKDLAVEGCRDYLVDALDARLSELVDSE